MRFLVVWAAISMMTPASADELQFTGSYWDRGDAFRLSIELEKGSGSFTWDGVPNLPVDPNKAQERQQVSLQLTEDETGLLHTLMSDLSLCHSGPLFPIGTGLSVRMRISQASQEPVEFGYFGVELEQILGRKAEQLPISLMKLVADGELSPDDRENFFNEIKEFATLLSNYRRKLDTLEDSFQLQQDPDWRALRTDLIEDFARSPEEDDFYNVIATTKEAALILDVISEPEIASHFTAEKDFNSIVFTIDELIRTESDIWGRFLPAPDLTSSTGKWTFLPQELRSLIQDFIEPSTTKEFSGYYEHPIFKIPLKHSGPAPRAVSERISFIDQSTLLPSLFEESPPQNSITHIGIREMEFSYRLSRCYVKTNRNGNARVSLFEVKDGQWSFIRQVDYDVWEEYRWEGPPSSPWKEKE